MLSVIATTQTSPRKSPIFQNLRRAVASSSPLLFNQILTNDYFGPLHLSHGRHAKTKNNQDARIVGMPVQQTA